MYKGGCVERELFYERKRAGTHDTPSRNGGIIRCFLSTRGTPCFSPVKRISGRKEIFFKKHLHFPSRYAILTKCLGRIHPAHLWRVVRAGRRSTIGNRVNGYNRFEGSNPSLSASGKPPHLICVRRKSDAIFFCGRHIFFARCWQKHPFTAYRRAVKSPSQIVCHKNRRDVSVRFVIHRTRSQVLED